MRREVITGAWKTLRERREGFEHGGWCRCVALARVDPEQPAFIVIEVDTIEGHAAVAGRRDLQLPAAMRGRPFLPVRASASASAPVLVGLSASSSSR
jgi:hypothetical protein